MRAPVLCAVVVISLGLAGVLEFLAQKSQRQGGLALSSSEDDISESVNIAYLYMPTTVAVLYSLLWTWIDLDVRRMQPWFELSRPHGANAEQSLLLNYPFEFLAFVPFKAWKQRHWPVFITGSVMMLIFWAITPLQGAIFGQQAVTVSTSSVMDPGSGLVAVEEQAALIDVSILNSAYGTTCKLRSFIPCTSHSRSLPIPYSRTPHYLERVHPCSWQIWALRVYVGLIVWGHFCQLLLKLEFKGTTETFRSIRRPNMPYFHFLP